MTDKMLSDFVHQQMTEIFSDNSELIVKNLMTAAAPDDLDKKTAQLLSAAMIMASEYSALYILHFLNKNGILHLPESNAAFLWTRDSSSEPRE